MPKVKEWPNHLGYDVGAAEVFIHAEKFRVFTPTRVLLVRYSTTTDPAEAVRICQAQGFSRAALDDMKYEDAEALFQSGAI